MRIRRFFDLFRHRAHFTRMQKEIKYGDMILYVDRGLYMDQRRTKTGMVGYVPRGADWIVIAVLDEAVEWDDILEWTPR